MFLRMPKWVLVDVLKGKYGFKLASYSCGKNLLIKLTQLKYLLGSSLALIHRQAILLCLLECPVVSCWLAGICLFLFCLVTVCGWPTRWGHTCGCFLVFLACCCLALRFWASILALSLSLGLCRTFLGTGGFVLSLFDLSILGFPSPFFGGGIGRLGQLLHCCPKF